MSRSGDELYALAQALTGLTEEEPLPRAAHARQLVDTAKSVLSRTRQEAIYQATRVQSYESVAAELDITTAAVNKAITLHGRHCKDTSPGQTT